MKASSASFQVHKVVARHFAYLTEVIASNRYLGQEEELYNKAYGKLHTEIAKAGLTNHSGPELTEYINDATTSKSENVALMKFASTTKQMIANSDPNLFLFVREGFTQVVSCNPLFAYKLQWKILDKMLSPNGFAFDQSVYDDFIPKIANQYKSCVYKHVSNAKNLRDLTADIEQLKQRHTLNCVTLSARDSNLLSPSTGRPTKPPMRRNPARPAAVFAGAGAADSKETSEMRVTESTGSVTLTDGTHCIASIKESNTAWSGLSQDKVTCEQKEAAEPSVKNVTNECSGQSVDLWKTGVLLYQLYTGVKPFDRQWEASQAIDERLFRTTKMEYLVNDPSSRSSLLYVPNVFKKSVLDEWKEACKKSVNWQQLRYRNGRRVPRQVAWYAGCECEYEYSGLRCGANPFTPVLLEILAFAIFVVNTKCPKKYQIDLNNVPNSCNLNWYFGKYDGCGWHADWEKIFRNLSNIVRVLSVSLGATRPFLYRKKGDANEYGKNLSSGDIVCMEELFNFHWQHSAPQVDFDVLDRINLTFRWICKHSCRLKQLVQSHQKSFQ